jgi:hypothetical protein
MSHLPLNLLSSSRPSPATPALAGGLAQDDTAQGAKLRPAARVAASQPAPVPVAPGVHKAATHEVLPVNRSLGSNSTHAALATADNSR